MAKEPRFDFWKLRWSLLLSAIFGGVTYLVYSQVDLPRPSDIWRITIFAAAFPLAIRILVGAANWWIGLQLRRRNH